MDFVDVEKIKSADKDEDSTPMTLKVDVQIKDIMVKLIRFPKKTESPALVLQLDVLTGVKIDKTTPLFVDARVAQVQAYQATIAVIEDKLAITVKDGVPKIIMPFDIKATIQQYQSVFEAIATNNKKSKAQGMKGGVIMDPMVMRFGYSDFDILMSSLNAIAPPALEEEDDDEEQKGPVRQLSSIEETKGDDEKKYDAGADTGSESSFSSEEDIQPSAKQKKMDKALELQMKDQDTLPDKGELEFSVEIGEIRLVLVNDKQLGSEIPLALFKIDHIGAELYSYKQRMAISAQFGFMVSIGTMK